MLSIKMLGETSFWKNGIPIVWQRRKPRSLLLFLAAHQTRTVTVSSVVSAFWPERSFREAFELLRSSIAEIHASCLWNDSDPLIQLKPQTQTLAIRQECITVDMRQWERYANEVCHQYREGRLEDAYQSCQTMTSLGWLPAAPDIMFEIWYQDVIRWPSVSLMNRAILRGGCAAIALNRPYDAIEWAGHMLSAQGDPSYAYLLIALSWWRIGDRPQLAEQALLLAAQHNPRLTQLIPALHIPWSFEEMEQQLYRFRYLDRWRSSI